jgi:hypothetical protein
MQESHDQIKLRSYCFFPQHAARSQDPKLRRCDPWQRAPRTALRERAPNKNCTLKTFLPNPAHQLSACTFSQGTVHMTRLLEPSKPMTDTSNNSALRHPGFTFSATGWFGTKTIFCAVHPFPSTPWARKMGDLSQKPLAPSPIHTTPISVPQKKWMRKTAQIRRPALAIFAPLCGYLVGRSMLDVRCSQFVLLCALRVSVVHSRFAANTCEHLRTPANTCEHLRTRTNGCGRPRTATDAYRRLLDRFKRL